MLKALEKIWQIQSYLEEHCQKKRIQNYRISFKSNMEIKIYILGEEGQIDLSLFQGREKIYFKWVNNYDLDDDSFLSTLFSSKSKKETHHDRLDFNLRRRLTSLINYNQYKPQPLPCPVISFYSYKGGLGRSTTLAAFASYYAIHYSKKVVVLDCDFEAPGFFNFFDLNSETLLRKNGIVEYLLDKKFSNSDLDLKKDYLIEISSEYSGEGEIYVMPSGNLSNELINEKDRLLGTQISHYLEGLSRLDLMSTGSMVDQLQKLITDLQSLLQPDVILIDSRTGFNDIFGMLAYQLSSLVVGFFGNNIQTLPGLYYFLDTVLKGKQNIDFVLVNSIISGTDLFRDFRKEVDSYLEQNTEDEIPPLDLFPILRDGRLEKIGTTIEYLPEFIDLIKSKTFMDFNALFEKIIEKIQIEKKDSFSLSSSPVEKANISSTKESILKKLENEFPQLYGEFESIDDNFIQEKFYFRKCMLEIFNIDKFILLGGKGTGKTLIYKAFKNNGFIQELQKRAKRESNQYLFIDIIPTHYEKEEKNIFKTDSFEFSQIPDSVYFFRRFWIIYIWNSLRLNIIPSVLDFQSELKPFPMLGDEKTRLHFEGLIQTKNEFILIEEDLKRLDQHLKVNNIFLFALFDQLDFIVMPNRWNQAISPLIDYCRTFPFSHIFPKLFLRSDLFEKLSNLTNKQALKIQSISLEWTKEEIFAYFFKIVFSVSKEDFFRVIRFYKQFKEDLVKNIESYLNKDKNQVPLEEVLLKPLVETFYGKYASSKRFGESYEWFFKNLKNADGTISLRPFLDLNKKGLEFYFEDNKKEEKDKSSSGEPILLAKYLTNSAARKVAVENHFKDLAGEKGNRDLKKIFEFIQHETPSYLKKSHLFQEEFYKLLSLVIKKYSDNKDSPLESKWVEELKDLLLVNGIVEELDRHGGKKLYRFAFLYKSFLGLKG